MNRFAAISLTNFLGFAVGNALYAVLLLMVAQHPISSSGNSDNTGLKSTKKIDWILFSAAILGLLWNTGNLIELVWHDYWSGQPSAFLRVVAYAALGFLPAVVVHSQRPGDNLAESAYKSKMLSAAAYLSSGIAAALHFSGALWGTAPSIYGLQFLTVTYLAILALLFLTVRGSVAGKSIQAAALAVFAVSALYLSHPNREGESIIAELVGHQASLPLVLLILYQDYRFAFADIFLKRALSFLFLIASVSAIYLLVVAPLAVIHQTHPQPDVQNIALMIAFGAVCAFSYVPLNRLAVWLVDSILLSRTAGEKLQIEIMDKISTLEPIEAVLTEVKEKLAGALTARTTFFREKYRETDFSPATLTTKAATSTTKAGKLRNSLVRTSGSGTEITIPTADEPQFELVLLDLAGGRCLLSGEIEMLEQVALHTARRIDQLRVTHERCERELREQEFSKLTTEAELRVLRAQINPHFLFNALTTISYLIQTAPDRAVSTLAQLTGLLRGSLRSSGEFQTLGDELKLIKSYLEIEQARFEERLRVKIDVPDDFISFRLPSLVLQPLVENAVKHGISPQKAGGRIRIAARKEKNALVLEVADTGAGISQDELRVKRASRVGLNNVEQRLQLYYHGAAEFKIESNTDGGGTVAEIKFDLSLIKSRNLSPKVSATATTTVMTIMTNAAGQII